MVSNVIKEVYITIFFYYSFCILFSSANTSTGGGYLLGELKAFNPKGSGTLLVLLGLGCCRFILMLITEHHCTKRHPKVVLYIRHTVLYLPYTIFFQFSFHSDTDYFLHQTLVKHFEPSPRTICAHPCDSLIIMMLLRQFSKGLLYFSRDYPQYLTWFFVLPHPPQPGLSSARILLGWFSQNPPYPSYVLLVIFHPLNPARFSCYKFTLVHAELEFYSISTLSSLFPYLNSPE